MKIIFIWHQCQLFYNYYYISQIIIFIKSIERALNVNIYFFYIIPIPLNTYLMYFFLHCSNRVGNMRITIPRSQLSTRIEAFLEMIK